jgi:hypothetical protein
MHSGGFLLAYFILIYSYFKKKTLSIPQAATVQTRRQPIPTMGNDDEWYIVRNLKSHLFDPLAFQTTIRAMDVHDIQ